MTISEVRARAVAIPVERETRISTRVLRERHYLLVEVTASDGVGMGYAYAGTNGGRLLVQAVTDLLQPVLRDAPTDDIHNVWARMYQESLLVGRRGAVLRAISAVDIALWDLRAKACRMPLAVLLGGSIAQPVPAYASGGYYRPDDGHYEEAVVREIVADRQAGFTDHKIKVGGLSLGQDVARVAAASEAIGTHGRLALDANNAYRSVEEALRAAMNVVRADWSCSGTEMFNAARRAYVGEMAALGVSLADIRRVRGGSVPLNTRQQLLKWMGCGFVCRGAGLSPAAASLATNASRGG